MQRKPRPKLKVYLPPELHRELKRHSQTHGVSMAHIVRTLIKHGIQATARLRPEGYAVALSERR